MMFIRTIRLENILSYGSGMSAFTLEPLNVLIGPNASGKSNLIEVLSLLEAAPRDLRVPIRLGGGTREWLWKGTDRLSTATVDVTVDYPEGRMPLRYKLSFTEVGNRFDLRDELLENEHPQHSYQDPYLYYHYQEGNPILNIRGESADLGFKRSLQREAVSPEQSILSQRRDPDSYPELTYLSHQFERMRFYREWNFGRNAPARLPQTADLPQDSVLEDGCNLSVVLSDLLNKPPIKRRILEGLRAFYPHIEDVVTPISGRTVQVFFHETGLYHPIPATRLSDGSLRYLCLLAVLCHPDPPPVICIEEPEIGIHPDVIPDVAKLLIEASSRSQIFVTTHSDVLVDALTETPESVVVCEKTKRATQLRRLNSETLKPWLELYRLGELWTRGDLGGNRW